MSVIGGRAEKTRSFQAFSVPDCGLRDRASPVHVFEGGQDPGDFPVKCRVVEPRNANSSPQSGRKLDFIKIVAPPASRRHQS
jgi:hypothetical protein